MDYLGQRVGGDGWREGGREGKERRGWGSLIMVRTTSSLSHLRTVLSHYMVLRPHWLFYDFARTKLKTYHDVIPISCLTEFPNVIQMAKVRGIVLNDDAQLIVCKNVQYTMYTCRRFVCCDSVKYHSDIFFLFFLKSKLVCEEVNVDRFFPVLYPKVRFTFVCTAAAPVYSMSLSVFSISSHIWHFYRLQDLLSPLMNKW